MIAGLRGYATERGSGFVGWTIPNRRPSSNREKRGKTLPISDAGTSQAGASLKVHRGRPKQRKPHPLQRTGLPGRHDNVVLGGTLLTDVSRCECRAEEYHPSQILQRLASPTWEKLMQRVLRTAALAAQLGISRTTLWRMVRDGEFPPARRITSGVKGWLPEDVEEWLRQRGAA